MSEYLIYLRKSRADSESETVEEVLSRHEKQLQEYALKELGYRIPEDDIYREVVSGETIDDRPEINILLRRIENKDIKGVITIEPQRLTRGDMLDCGTIVHVFRYTDTLIMTPNKVYDLSDKFDRKFFEMELSRGNDYLEYTKEILQRGKIASVKNGDYLGNFSPLGYDKIKIDKSNTLTPNEDAEIVKLIFDLYVTENMGWTRIARQLDDMGVRPKRSDHWNQQTIRTILQNPVYIGKIRWNYRKGVKSYENGKIIRHTPRSQDYMLIDGKHPAIIDEELFNKAQKIIGSKPKNKPSNKLINPLAGLLFCKKCGKALSYRTYNKCEPRYLCNNQVHCGCRSSKADAVIQAVIDSVNVIIKDFEFKLEHQSVDNTEMYNNIIHNLEKELNKLELRQNELYDLLEEKIYSRLVFTARNNMLAVQRNELNEKIKNAKMMKPIIINYDEKIMKFSKVIEYLKNDQIDADAKNKMLKSIISRIEYSTIPVNKKNNGRWIEHNVQLDIYLIDR